MVKYSISKSFYGVNWPKLDWLNDHNGSEMNQIFLRQEFI